MSQANDYYRILHVDPDAPVEIIRSSYRTLMQRMKKHPDLGGEHKGAALINEAYAVLTDPQKRAEYDRSRLGVAKGPSPRARRETTQGQCLFCAAPNKLGRAPEADDNCFSCNSPLYPAEHLRLDTADQRLMERISREAPVRCYTEWPQGNGFPAHMRDLSLNGMQVTAAFRPDEGSIFKVDSAPCQSLARVVWCAEHGEEWLIGLEFVTLRFNRSRGSFVSAEV